MSNLRTVQTISHLLRGEIHSNIPTPQFGIVKLPIFVDFVNLQIKYWDTIPVYEDEEYTLVVAAKKGRGIDLGSPHWVYNKDIKDIDAVKNIALKNTKLVEFFMATLKQVSS